MKIEFNVPDDKAPILVDALCSIYGYSEFSKDTIGEPTEERNPETRAEFAKRMTIQFWQESVKAYKLKIARNDAVDAVTVPNIEVT